MAFSNSFHSSAKKHAIGSASKLASVEAHNEREFTSAKYNADKTRLIQGELGLAVNVQTAINDIFQQYIEEYNRKQRRKDRKIEGTAFEYFCGNSKLDIAAEAVYQIGDMDFWSRWRTDEVIGHTKKGEEIVRHTFPPEVVEVMSEIHRRQMDAYESIYQTHGQKILDKIELQYARCQDTLDRYRESQNYDRYVDIAETKPKARKAKIQKLSDAELLDYTEFAEAYYSAQDIEKRQYRERIIKGQMHIKNIQGMGHFDEWSVHAHGVSICWADGYRNGLPSRVAKAVVLNRYALEVIQERLHEIAEEEIAKHPEIFEQKQLKEKGEGHRMNYTTEQIIRKKNAELRQENRELQLERSRLSGQVGLMEVRKSDIDYDIKAAQATVSELQQQNAELAAQIAAGKEELAEICEIKTMAERDQMAAEVETQIDEVQSLFDIVDEFCFAAEEDKYYGATRWHSLMEDFLYRWNQARERAYELIDSIKEKIRSIKIFELVKQILPENRVAEHLQDQFNSRIASAYSRAPRQKGNAETEKEI